MKRSTPPPRWGGRAKTLADHWRLRVDRSTRISSSRSLPTSKSTGRPRLKRCVSNSFVFSDLGPVQTPGGVRAGRAGGQLEGGTLHFEPNLIRKSDCAAQHIPTAMMQRKKSCVAFPADHVLRQESPVRALGRISSPSAEIEATLCAPPPHAAFSRPTGIELIKEMLAQRSRFERHLPATMATAS
jgi:hypothetical protein